MCTMFCDRMCDRMWRGPATALLGIADHHMKYQGQVWFILFLLGEWDGILGSSPKIPYSDGEDEQITCNKVVEDYELKLCEEISQWGTLGAISRKKVAGWELVMVKSNLETTQMYKAILTFPRDHPARRVMMDGFMTSLWWWCAVFKHFLGHLIFWHLNFWIRIL